MARLFRGNQASRRRIRRKVFFPFRGTAVEKRSMSSGFFPPPLSRVYRTPEPVRPWPGLCEYHQTSPGPDIEDFTRPDTNSAVEVLCRRVVKTFPPRRHEFRLYTRFITPAAVAGAAGTTVLFTCHQRRKYSRPSVSSTYSTRLRLAVSSSLSSRERMFKFDRMPILLLDVNQCFYQKDTD